MHVQLQWQNCRKCLRPEELVGVSGGDRPVSSSISLQCGVKSNPIFSIYLLLVLPTRSAQVIAFIYHRFRVWGARREGSPYIY